MSKEALRTQLDALRFENQWLVAENAKLRDAHPEGAVRADAEAEITRLKELVSKLQEETVVANSTTDAVEARIQELTDAAERHREMIAKLEDDLAHSDAERNQLGEEQLKLLEKLEAINRDKELECLRAVNDERQKWEAREEQLLKQITTLEKLARHYSEQEQADSQYPERCRDQEEDLPAETSVDRGEQGILTGRSVGVESEPHPLMEHNRPMYQSSLVAHQLPPLAPFKGDMAPDFETIDEWLERFTMLAEEYNC